MKPVLLFFFVLVCFFSNAQSDKKISVSDSASLSVQPDLILQQSKQGFGIKDPATPSPEQQGYTKTIVNGKEIYRKEQGQLKLEYILN